MQTYLTKSPEEASEFIKKGGLVAFPTETVYGLGASVFNEGAVRRIFEAKKRPADNPLIAHIGFQEQISLLASRVTSTALLLIEKFFPGPLTVVLPKTDNVPLVATAGLDTIGIRMPRHELALKFLRLCQVPVCAPSANLSGKPSPTNWEAVYEDLNGRIDCILQGEVTDIGLESTVVDCTSDEALVLRLGAISLEDLKAVLPNVKVYSPKANEPVRSPGLRHRHYAPEASVFLISSLDEAEEEKCTKAFIGLHEPKGDFLLKKVCASVEEYAHELYAFLRECDRLRVEKVFCEVVPETGIGAALMDRLRRASAK